MSKESPNHSSVSEYVPAQIEPKWQAHWKANKTFASTEDSTQPKYYILDMFPYPSGDGLHVGHPEGYTATDILARYKRMKGFNVLHPMGWDSFGLPAEQYAIQTGTHPRLTTEKNIERFKAQIDSLGFSYDWEREVTTSSEDYYKWTQWIFRKLYEKGLAYESHEPVNWCPALGTVLANEEVIDGKSERGGHPVVRKPMRQWVLKITEYAQRLLEDLDLVDWPESIKEMQRNWIGRSQGAYVRFGIKGHPQLSFEVFTTRPDTLFGVTFCVLAPEHALVKKITTSDKKAEVEDYLRATELKSEMDRTNQQLEKTGAFVGAYAIHPVTGAEIPIFIADYVLAHYGEGAIMAVPAHDERDHAFAQKYHLPIVQVLDGAQAPIEEKAHTGNGKLLASDFLNGLEKDEAIVKMTGYLEDHKLGHAAITYKLRDWLFSRQRYWGEPFPLCHDSEGNTILLSEKELPITLPELDDFAPAGTGESPLAKATDWLRVNRDGKTYLRETNTMPQWAGSCWYYLRYCDPKNTQEPWDREKEKYWMPVDLYVGGAEHAVLHLLYARFWHKVLYDLGYVSTPEPFLKLVNQGMILGENGEKMSKSRGNVINPDDVVAQWGADSLRLYEMFMGPLEATKPWQTAGLGGVHRFLKRVWRLYVTEESGELSGDVLASETLDGIEKKLHQTIKKVSEDLEGLRFNTAISAMMEFVNECYKHKASLKKKDALDFVKLVNPFAPHLAEELWHRMGETEELTYASWPTFEEKFLVEDSITMSVQVNGKLRATLQVESSSSKQEIVSLARGDEKVQKFLEGKSIIKEIYVPGRIVNFVVK